MARFSLARVPYYIIVAIFTGLSAFVALINNSSVYGIESDVYLAIFVIALGLCLASLAYLFTAQRGASDEVDLEVAGLQFGKVYYYFGVIGVAFYRIGVGYHQNHVGTGLQSVYGIGWLLASIVVLAFSYANYRSYTAKTAVGSGAAEAGHAPSAHGHRYR